MSGWTKTKQVSAGTYHVLGLKEDGTVVCVGGQPGDGACNVSSWENIVQIVGAGYHSIGLKKDGTVVATGNNDYGQLEVSSWLDVTAISGGRYHTIALTSDGKFLAIGSNKFGQLDGSKVIESSEETKDTTSIDKNDNDSNSTENQDVEVVEVETKPITDFKVYLDNEQLINLELTDVKPRIANAIYNPFDFSLKFSGETDMYILGLGCSGGNTYIYPLDVKIVNNKSNVNYDFGANIIEKCPYKDISFMIAEVVGYNDNREYKISSWYNINEKYIVAKDLERLFLDKSTLTIDSNYLVRSNISGRLDVSSNEMGNDIKFIDGLNLTYRLSSNGVDLKKVLSTFPNNIRIHMSLIILVLKNNILFAIQ